MKKTLKLFLGDKLISNIRRLKIKKSHSKLQKKLVETEVAETNKRKLFYGSFIKKDDLCFDVGANMGNRIIPLLELGARIVAIKQQEKCYKVLKQ